MATGTQASLDAAELERLVKAVDPTVFLVPPRILRRVIRADRKLAGIGLDVPHRKSYLIGRDALRRLVEKEEIGLKPDGNLPAVAILLERPDPEALAGQPREQVLLGYWRLLFHAHVHLALERRLTERKVSEAALRRRIGRIGPTEFQEIRAVLRQEHLLLPPRDDRTVYIEFAAVYLELRHFAPALLPRYFPALQSYEPIDLLLAGEVDAARLFAGTRLPGAAAPAAGAEPAAEVPEPPEEPPPLPPVTAEEHRRLLEKADRAAAIGNTVRAMILRTRAAAVADPALAEAAQASANAALNQLAERLRAALGQPAGAEQGWRQALAPLREPAARGLWPAEARLLYDLQKVCIDRERDVYAVDLAEWIVSLGRRPVKRLLVDQPDVRALRHLRGAARRLAAARIPEGNRARLAALLSAAVHDGEHRLREKLRPVITDALEQVGMRPGNFPEQIAQAKLTEELLDRIVETGHLNMGHLRDAVSRNNLKLPDLAGPVEFVRGNRLLRANRRFAEVLDGIYHCGEVYLRWLQRFSLLTSATRPGRFLTLYFALPFGGAYLGLQGLYHLADDFLGVHLHALASLVTVGLLGLFLFLVLHVPRFRRAVVRGLLLAGRGAKALAELPAAFLRLPLVRRLLRSRALRFAYHYVLKPLALAGLAGLILWLRGAPPDAIAWGAAGVFALANLALNSRLARDLEEAVADWLLLSWRRLLLDILPGIVRWLLDFFKRVLEAIDRLLYGMDEWFRFRTGDSRLSVILKAVLGLFWFAAAYVVRFAVNLLIEPQVNPIKHFPVVTVSHKLLLPLIPGLARVLEVTMEHGVALTLATLIMASIPGVFGFLVWELKENWRLYEANRPAELRPVPIGHHGETMPRLLRPGLHSGTLPKLFARLRRAERRALRTGSRRAVRKQREALHEVEEAVRRFVERDLLAVLRRSRGWGGLLIECGEILLGSNRVGVELRCPALDGPGLRVSFEERSGWLVAAVAEAGWLGQLPAELRRALRAALAGWYKFAGVDLVREQVEALLGGATFDLANEGLVVWTGAVGEGEVLYDLNAEPPFVPRVLAGQPSAALPTLPAVPLLFRDVPLPWRLWVEVWEQEQTGKGLPESFLEGVRLLPGGECR